MTGTFIKPVLRERYVKSFIRFQEIKTKEHQRDSEGHFYSSQKKHGNHGVFVTPGNIGFRQ